LGAPDERSRHFLIGLAALSLLGFAICLAYALLVSPNEILAGDAAQYHGLARGISNGQGYSTLASLLQGHPKPTAQHPPLFPLLLAGLYELGISSLDAQRAALCVLGGAGVALVGLLGRQLAGPRAGLIAAGLAALYPNFWVLDGMAMVEALYVPLIAGALLLTYLTIARPTVWRAVALGAAIGLVTLSRPEGLVLLLLMALVVALRIPAARLRTALVVVAAGLVVVSPWIVRNAIVLDKFPLLSTNGGLTAMVANCDSAYYDRVGFFNADCSLACIRYRDDELEQSACGTRVARRYAEDHAGRVPVVVLARVARTWNLYAIDNDLSYAQFGGRNRTAGTAGLVVYFLLLPLAAWGAVLLARRGITPLPLLVPFVVVTFATALSFGFSRYRVGAEVPLVALAAVALSSGREWMNERSPSA
jgi:4-amino-4-deoxy-L-arabinose transferase-like glycosyltransferase